MYARIGADDVDWLADPRPELLESATRIRPVSGGTHVLFEGLGIASTQRLALADVGGSIVTALWPAELQPQARWLYDDDRAVRLIETARSLEWSAVPSPHLAFFNSSPSQRLYMAPEIDAVAYAKRWIDSDLSYARQYKGVEIDELWTWLKDRGYADDLDDPMFAKFRVVLGKRPAHLRPALRLKKRWPLGTATAAAIRSDTNAILEAAGEPALP